MIDPSDIVTVEMDEVTAARIAKTSKLLERGRNLDDNIVGICIACGTVITNEPPVNHRCPLARR